MQPVWRYYCSTAVRDFGVAPKAFLSTANSPEQHRKPERTPSSMQVGMMHSSNPNTVVAYNSNSNLSGTLLIISASKVSYLNLIIYSLNTGNGSSITT